MERGAREEPHAQPHPQPLSNDSIWRGEQENLLIFRVGRDRWAQTMKNKSLTPMSGCRRPWLGALKNTPVPAVLAQAGQAGPLPPLQMKGHICPYRMLRERGEKRLTAGFGQFGPFRGGSGEEERRDQEAGADFV